MPPSDPKRSRWFPSQAQLGDPSALERALRQVLTQHYALVDRVNAMEAGGAAKGAKGTVSAKTSAGTFPPGSGPADSYLLGLPVTPVDVETLADGATLKYVAKQRTFTFS